MSEHATAKKKAFQEKMDAAVAFSAEIDESPETMDTPENREKLTAFSRSPTRSAARSLATT